MMNFEEALDTDLRNAQEVNAATVAIKTFSEYGKEVILARALADLRDGLKPSQRRALWAMKNLKLSLSGSHKKSARIVGEMIGRYHPHGDLSAYETMVGMAQPWINNLHLIDGQGNWGSIDGDEAAKQRYTEARFSDFGYLFLRDLSPHSVDFVPNYDDTEKEPVVMPVPFPNILINGVPPGSIAVGITSKIFPNNTTEIMNAMIESLKRRRDDKKMTVAAFAKHVAGPDFPMGGIIYDLDFQKVIETGEGGFRFRSGYDIEKIGRRKMLVFRHVPYYFQKGALLDEILNLKRTSKSKFASQIASIRDESDKDEIRMVVELKTGANPDEIAAFLYKNTNLDTSFKYQSYVLDTNEQKEFFPAKLGLLDMLEKYLNFKEDVFLRELEEKLSKLKARLHLLEGFLRAIDMIDEVIKVVKKANGKADAAKKLHDELKFSEPQSLAIVSMPLYKISKLEKEVILKEKARVESEIEDIEEKLNNKREFYNALIEDAKIIKKKIGKKRKTEIREKVAKISLDETVPKQLAFLLITKIGYVIKLSSREFTRYKTGEYQPPLIDGDQVVLEIETDTRQTALFISQNGTVFGRKVFQIPDGRNFMKSLIESDYDIVSVVTPVEMNGFLLFVTEDGYVKFVKAEEFQGALRKTGIVGAKPTILKVFYIDTIREDMTITLYGKLKKITFLLSQISVQGRAARGVTGIKLSREDKIVDAVIEQNTRKKIQNRGGAGLKV